MLLYVLKLNQNAKMPEAYGKYYAYPVITQTVGIDGLAEHMASHNTPFSKGGISPLQRPHYFTSSYTYLFSKKVILLSFLG